MASSTVVDRLRGINAVQITVVTDDELWSRILALDPDPRLTQPPRQRPQPTARASHALVRLPRRWAFAGIVVLVAAGLALNGLLPGSTPSAAQAFPVLSRPATLTPAALQRALEVYGAAPGAAGLDLAHGRPVQTPWGRGYVLTNRDQSVICAVAPGTSRDSWGASCAQTALARERGTSPVEFSYQPSVGTARYLVLLPTGATATVKAPQQPPHAVPVRDGVVALTVAQPLALTTHIGGQAHTTRLTPQAASASPQPPTWSQTTTTSSGSVTSAG